MPETASSQALDTFPRLLLNHARVRGDKPAMREKDLGIWQCWTWQDVADEVRALACGLAEMGFKRGENVAIVGDNRPRMYMMMSAVQCLGGVPVPLYQDAVANEMLFVLVDAEIRFLFVEDQEQVDKVLELQAQLPQLRHLFYDDPHGMRHYTQPFIHDVRELMEMGRIHNRNHPDLLIRKVAAGNADDVSVMLYTSGTTGKPKGVCLTHNAFISAARGGVDFDRLTADENILSYLPMAWVGDHLFSFAQAMMTGFTINCPESAETVMNDLREIGPTYYFAPPRVFENLLTQVMIRMEDASAIKQKMFHFFMAVARRCGAEILDGKAVALADRLLYALGNFFVFGPLKNVLGLSRVRVAYTAGAAIGPDLFRFYRSIGINLKQLYGQTETCAYVCLQPDGEIKFDSVGKPAPGVEVKIADNGEILVKGPMLLREYYKRPDATAEAINADGYFMTGDAGLFDDEGHLKIIDRAKDVGKLVNGAMFAPNFIENKLKFFPFVKEAVAFGDGREMVCAFINIDIGAVGNWAERRGIAYSGYTDLAAKAEVYGLIQESIEQVNSELLGEGVLADSQIHRFLILHKELDPDDDELTRTRKVRRGFVAEKYAVLIDALYSGRDSQFIETAVKFEDGRQGKVAADLAIRNLKVFGAAGREAS
ncbi:MAG: Long-chain-fatty-acid--CoA ligase FadD15 [Candidatus Accumulibacter regalis]|jgi:long-chain acyl-CoA synthetase|uniref:Long-chain-fatty-acid--CoA ligase FadD15 n=1 Tax=Accumulibacter regalis TaxID=522306 RepID=A0A011QPZ5_ACCRE|nr:AMP-binding protein [Accumulibacter sp.]EXI91165.1 MAG: Long-chain-fatty-acid--CoA ligase FadD15 [Candidatus Accumulibacter regalis]MQM33062.1 long-chain fatty acid--CoA ligase [Candidatus Accumulibacter phosphatis]MBN8516153.1 long-chain fatty acid--CoA ligase [Accumulibacter sp.]HRE68941.1 long-chain fatty acid--CoA ligase [Accumulibacter sp.]HRI91493.1 long-chain fatty acid--CoA ligase [Accumulibacter sp.]